VKEALLAIILAIFLALAYRCGANDEKQRSINSGIIEKSGQHYSVVLIEEKWVTTNNPQTERNQAMSENEIIDETETELNQQQEYDLHLQKAKLLLADYAVKEAEKKADHVVAKKQYEEQREYVAALIEDGNPDDKAGRFNQDEEDSTEGAEPPEEADNE